MRSFRTEISIPASGFKIDHRTKILSIGSCFTEHIGQKLIDLKFRIDQNPFGILYNPQSIFTCLMRIMDPRPYEQAELVFHQGRWHSMDHHGAFSNTDPEICLSRINQRIERSATNFKRAGVLILTFGTAWVYKYKQTGEFAANCHKIPANEFERVLLDAEEISALFTALFTAIFQGNPNLKIIFTVSPVRHLKDGFAENQLSKSTLILAINRLMKQFPELGYFPSYEIIMDDLRDYRFYKEDMVHPNSQAVEYIWSRFSDTYFTDETRSLIKELQKIRSAMNHRPFNSESQEYIEFREAQLTKVLELKKRYPETDLKEEIDYFS